MLDRLNDAVLQPNDSFALIVSLQSIRHHDTEKTAPSVRVKLNDFLEKYGSANTDPIFDLVIMDEAHHLRNSDTASFKTGERLRDVSRYMILLSATPIQTSSRNLYNLLKLLSPEDFYDAATFETLLNENRPLIFFANALRGDKPIDELQSLYNDAKSFLSDDLKNCIEHNLYQNVIIPEQRMRLYNLLQNTSFYSQFFTRTRKRDVLENRIVRDANTWYFSLSEEEAEIYNKVTDF